MRKPDHLPLQRIVRAAAGDHLPAQPLARKPMTREQAGVTLNSVIQNVMKERGVNYLQALEIVQREKPAVIAGYMAVQNRGKR